MPSRSSRNNNARKHASTTRGIEPHHPQPSTQRLTSPSLPFSPPTHLPTPLPEEHIPVSAPALGLLNFAPSAAGEENNDVALSRLIDFDTPTPPPQPFSPLQEGAAYDVEASLFSEDGSEGPYRSPPYREARLPAESSPPPLPVLPRYNEGFGGEGVQEEMGWGDGSTRGHTFTR